LLKSTFTEEQIQELKTKLEIQTEEKEIQMPPRDSNKNILEIKEIKK